MSRKSARVSRGGMDKGAPSILKRKRKAGFDLEEACSSETATSRAICLDDTDCSDIENRLTVRPITPSPLPKLKWGDNNNVWRNMIEKDQAHPRDPMVFQYHPELQSKMRAILLDWLIEVSEVYHLHRETFYLSQDCMDRYLAVQNDIQRDHLQLIGITCLFIASKVEEIYPPRLTEFAFVTDGACTEKEILQQELIILMHLDWNVTPITICSWLKILLQVQACRQNNDGDTEFEMQKYNVHAFAQLCQLIDLCLLDISCLQFPYRVIATSAIVHLVSKEDGISSSGFTWEEVKGCVVWMQPFCEVILENTKFERMCMKHSSACENHNIQTHNIRLKFLEQVHFKQSKQLKSNRANEIHGLGILTPPQVKKRVCLRLNPE